MSTAGIVFCLVAALAVLVFWSVWWVERSAERALQDHQDWIEARMRHEHLRDMQPAPRVPAPTHPRGPGSFTGSSLRAGRAGVRGSAPGEKA